jgi:hypothetical protein
VQTILTKSQAPIELYIPQRRKRYNGDSTAKIPTNRPATSRGEDRSASKIFLAMAKSSCETSSKILQISPSVQTAKMKMNGNRMTFRNYRVRLDKALCWPFNIEAGILFE